MQVIIFKDPTSGIVAVTVPTENVLKDHTIYEVAVKDVPAGLPFKIVDTSELPLEAPQEAWDVDEALLDDGVGGESYEFS